MRQMVSHVEDGFVRYWVADDDGEMTEVARVNVGSNFGAERAIMLGVNLVEAVGLNGKRRSAAKPRELEAGGEAHQPAVKKKGRKARGSRVDRSYITLDMVAEALGTFERPAFLYEIAEKLGYTDKVDRQVVSNRIVHLVNTSRVMVAGKEKRDAGGPPASLYVLAD